MLQTILTPRYVTYLGYDNWKYCAISIFSWIVSIRFTSLKLHSSKHSPQENPWTASSDRDGNQSIISVRLFTCKLLKELKHGAYPKKVVFFFHPDIRKLHKKKQVSGNLSVNHILKSQESPPWKPHIQNLREIGLCKK